MIRLNQAKAQRTSLSSMHPITSFCYYVGVLLLSMLFLHPVFLLLELVLLVGMNLMQGNGSAMLKMFKGIWPFMLAILVINPLLNHRGTHFLFYIGNNPITLEAVSYGLLMALSFCGVMLLFISYNSILTTHKFLYLFSRLSPQLALLTMITIRFVPLFIRRLTTITTIQKTRGIQLESGTLKERATNGIHLIEILLTSSLEDALQTADSMEARGYGVTKRTSYLSYAFSIRDGMSLVVGSLIMLICLYGSQQGYGSLIIYPTLTSWEITGFYNWFLLGLSISFISYPLLLEGGEELWWFWQKFKS